MHELISVSLENSCAIRNTYDMMIKMLYRYKVMN